MRAYTRGNGPDAYKPIDTRSLLHMPPQYVSDPTPQYVRLGELSDIITEDRMKFGALRVSEYKHLNTWNYNDNLKEFIAWCTQNIASNEGVIACCEDFRQPSHTFKLKLKYWVYYKLLPGRQLIYDYCSFNSNTTLHDRSFLETQAGMLTKPGMYSILSFHDTNIIRANPGAPMSEDEVTQYNNIHRVIYNQRDERNHLSRIKRK